VTWKGDLFEALHNAPGHATVQGSARLDRQHHVTTGEPFGRGTTVAGSAENAPNGPGLIESSTSFVEFCYQSDEWRVELDGRIVIGKDDHLLLYTPGMGTTATAHLDPRGAIFGTVSEFLFPVSLIPLFTFDIIDTAAVCGRQTWHVAVSPRSRFGARRPFFASPDAVTEMWFDQETGILLRNCPGTPNGGATGLEVLTIDTDAAVSASLFEFQSPDGTCTRNQASRIIEMQASQHIPDGPPPDNEHYARESVEHAFARMSEADDHQSALVNVQSGSNLVPSAAEAFRRLLGGGDSTGPVPQRVKFLNDREAVTWFILPGFGSFEGRAILQDGRWKVSRATYADLLRRAGMVCPPPP
jgi:hypothetical protein